MNSLKLPDLIDLNDYGGCFENFEEAVYSVFKKDFIESRPYYKGVKIALKKHPMNNFKEATYYHLTHEGSDESNRVPDLRRMERIGYPKPIIENNYHSDLICWRNKRKNKERILILHEKERYLVVLEDRGKYILPWTAYYIEYDNKIKRLKKEHDNWHKSKSRQINKS